ncbi:MAG: ATP-binding cassette domain-containing protein [Bacillus sp. (in: firmicutes)]
MTAIWTNGLSKSFNGKKVVDTVSLSVNSGEIFGFLGRNGAGKSTFINMLTGILMPTKGEFSLLGGIEQKKIGVLPDYSMFYDNMTAYKHLVFLSKVSGYKPTKTHILNTLELVGLENAMHEKVSKFSFGMKKKLGIAQAIVNNPDLIFLDEPTSGVDAESAIQIKDLIRSLNSAGKTIFMTSHNLNEVEEICTRIAIMKEGKIHLEGTLSELKSAFQNVISTKIRLQPELSLGTRKEISNFMEVNFSNFRWSRNFLVIDMENEDGIPMVLRFLMKLDVNVYSISTIEPSLEEIFLSKNQAI